MVAYSLLVPRVSLRIPSFFGPVVLGTALIIVSAITSPTYQGFNVAKFSDPTFKGTLGIWGVCQSYKQDNATTSNPNGTTTGNTTLDAIISKQGSHQGCSSSMLGWTYSLPVNSTGITTVALPNTNLGVNVPEGSDAGDGYTYVRVFNSSQSTPLIVHLISGIVLAIGILLLLIPYKNFQESSPNLARLLKTGSITLVLTWIGFALGLIAFAIDLVVSINTVNQFNNATQPGGTHATLGNIQWFVLAGSIVLIPGFLSTRGQMGDHGH